MSNGKMKSGNYTSPTKSSQQKKQVPPTQQPPNIHSKLNTMYTSIQDIKQELAHEVTATESMEKQNI